MNSSTRQAAVGRILLFGTVVVWGWTFVATKIALAHVTPVELLGLRMAVGVPLLVVMALVQRTPFTFDRREWGTLALAGGVFATHFLVQITGIRYTTATNAGWIISTSPLVIAVLSFLMLRERVGRDVVAGIVLASGGVVLLVSHGDLAGLGWLRSRGDWLVLATAFTWALYTIVTRDLSRSRPALAVTLVVLLPSLVICLGWMAAHSDWRQLARLPADALVAIVFLGVLGTALAQWFWQIGVARLGAAKAGIFLYLEPIATTVLAVPLMHEPFGPLTIVGGGLVLLGVWWAERRRAR